MGIGSLIGLIIAGIVFVGAGIAAFMRQYKMGPWIDEKEIPIELPPPPQPPVEASERLLWDTPKHAYHSVRVLCDDADLTTDEKNLICACIYQESMFKNTAKNENKSKTTGAVLSTDWGLCQVNDHYHIGPGKDFPSVDFVLENPAEVVSWMITCYKQGNLKMWVSYSSGTYIKWLSTWSPMWLLKVL